MGARPECILFAITTAGSNTISACKQHYDYCCQILEGDEVKESQFVLIYELDGENEIDNPDLWIKADPNLDTSVDRIAFEDTIKKARGEYPRSGSKCSLNALIFGAMEPNLG